MRLSKHFTRKEFECKCGCGFDVVDAELIQVLEIVRRHFGKPLLITSGARCKKHNKSMGAKNSQHLIGKAADFIVNGIQESTVQIFLEGKFRNTYGIGRYSGRTHVDVRSTKARWTVT